MFVFLELWWFYGYFSYSCIIHFSFSRYLLYDTICVCMCVLRKIGTKRNYPSYEMEIKAFRMFVLLPAILFIRNEKNNNMHKKKAKIDWKWYIFFAISTLMCLFSFLLHLIPHTLYMYVCDMVYEWTNFIYMHEIFIISRVSKKTNDASQWWKSELE